MVEAWVEIGFVCHETPWLRCPVDDCSSFTFILYAKNFRYNWISIYIGTTCTICLWPDLCIHSSSGLMQSQIFDVCDFSLFDKKLMKENLFRTDLYSIKKNIIPIPPNPNVFNPRSYRHTKRSITFILSVWRNRRQMIYGRLHLIKIFGLNPIST